MRPNLFQRSIALLLAAALAAPVGADLSPHTRHTTVARRLSGGSEVIFGSEALAFSGLSDQRPDAGSGTRKAVGSLGRWVRNTNGGLSPFNNNTFRWMAGSAYLALLMVLHFDWPQIAPWLAFGGWIKPTVVRSFLTMVPVILSDHYWPPISNFLQTWDRPGRSRARRAVVLIHFLGVIALYSYAFRDLRTAGSTILLTIGILILSVKGPPLLQTLILRVRRKRLTPSLSIIQALFLPILWLPAAIHWPAEVHDYAHKIKSWLIHSNPIELLIGVPGLLLAAYFAQIARLVLERLWLWGKQHRSRARARLALGMTNAQSPISKALVELLPLAVIIRVTYVELTRSAANMPLSASDHWFTAFPLLIMSAVGARFLLAAAAEQRRAGRSRIAAALVGLGLILLTWPLVAGYAMAFISARLHVAIGPSLLRSLNWTQVFFTAMIVPANLPVLSVDSAASLHANPSDDALQSYELPQWMMDLFLVNMVNALQQSYGYYRFVHFLKRVRLSARYRENRELAEEFKQGFDITRIRRGTQFFILRPGDEDFREPSIGERLSPEDRILWVYPKTPALYDALRNLGESELTALEQLLRRRELKNHAPWIRRNQDDIRVGSGPVIEWLVRAFPGELESVFLLIDLLGNYPEKAAKTVLDLRSTEEFSKSPDPREFIATLGRLEWRNAYLDALHALTLERLWNPAPTPCLNGIAREAA